MHAQTSWHLPGCWVVSWCSRLRHQLEDSRKHGEEGAFLEEPTAELGEGARRVFSFFVSLHHHQGVFYSDLFIAIFSSSSPLTVSDRCLLSSVPSPYPSRRSCLLVTWCAILRTIPQLHRYLGEHLPKTPVASTHLTGQYIRVMQRYSHNDKERLTPGVK